MAAGKNIIKKQTTNETYLYLINEYK